MVIVIVVFLSSCILVLNLVSLSVRRVTCIAEYIHLIIKKELCRWSTFILYSYIFSCIHLSCILNIIDELFQLFSIKLPVYLKNIGFILILTQLIVV